MIFTDELQEFRTGSIFAKQINTANNGSIYSGTTWITGSPTLYALGFPGSPAHGKVFDPNLANGSGAFSISLWGNTLDDMSAGTRRIFNVSGTTGRIELIYQQTSAKNGFVVSDGGSTVTITSPGSYNDGNWHHFAFIRHTGSNRLYMYGDGVLIQNGVDTTNVGSTIASGLTPLLIGTIGTTVGPNQTFLGSLADIRFYNKIITPGEIGSLFSGLSVQGGLTMWLKGDEGSGGLLSDNSYSSTAFSQLYDNINGTIQAVNTTNAEYGSAGSIFIVESGTNEKILTLKPNSLRSEHPQTYGVDVNGTTGSPWTHIDCSINKPFYILGSDLTSTFYYDNISILYR